MEAPTASQLFWTNLVQHVPEFAGRYQRELDSEDGELLVHLMFGLELVPYVEELARPPSEATRSSFGASARAPHRDAADNPPATSADVLRRILAGVENGLANGDHYLREAILVSFIENLAQHERSGKLGNQEVARLRELFGPNLQAGCEALQQYLDQPYFHDRTAEYRFIQWAPVDN